MSASYESMAIKRKYYPIADAANMIGCTEADLIHLGANWQLDIWATFDHNLRAWHSTHQGEKDESVLVNLNVGLHQLNPIDLESLECGRKDWLTVVHLGRDSYHLVKEGDVQPSEMFIMTAEIESILAEAAAPSEQVALPDSNTRSQGTRPAVGVTVTLPHMTRSLEAVFKVMWENWKDPDPRRLPKQINIAREIDAALGYKSEKDDMPSRNAKVIAAIIKPDMLDGTD
jgi:hypothetical protein